MKDIIDTNSENVKKNFNELSENELTSFHKKQLLQNKDTFHFEVPIFIKQKIDKNNNITETVHPILLAEYFIAHTEYIIVRGNAIEQEQIYYYSNKGVYILSSDKDIKALLQKIITDYNCELVNMRILNEAYNYLILNKEPISQDSLDANEDIINFENGVYHISSDRLLPHSPYYLSSIQIPCRWTGRPTATPVFDKYIKTLTNNQQNIEWLIMQYLGVIISNIEGYKLKKSLLIYGEGDTGKSKIKELAELLVGKQNCCQTSLQKLEERFGAYALYNKRLAGDADMSFLSIKELNIFKLVTGGDNIMLEAKNQNPFSYKYKGLLLFCANEKPRFGGDRGNAIYNRFLLIRCDNVIPKLEQDKNLINKMFAEKEGIVYLLVQALKSVVDNKLEFTIPESVYQEVEDYRSYNSPVHSFFEECLELREDINKIEDKCSKGVIYDAYRSWCGTKIIPNKSMFYSELMQIDNRTEDNFIKKTKKNIFCIYRLNLQTYNEISQKINYIDEYYEYLNRTV